MRTRTYQKDVRAAALRDELLAAGVPVLAVRPPTEAGGPATIDLDDRAVDATVDAVLAAHDAAALDAAAAQDRTRLQQDVATVKAFLNAASGTATNTQRDNATKALARVVQRVVSELND